jgi:ATP-dependent Lhr-like helicase
MGYKVAANNYYLKCEGSNASLQSITELIGRMRQDEFWEADEVKKNMLRMLPNYRLSKFQYCLPGEYQMELVANELLDVPGTKTFLSLLPLQHLPDFLH